VIETREQPWGLEIVGFGRPFGLGLNAGRQLHVTDMDRHQIIRLDTDRRSYDVLSEPGVWNGPHSIDFAADGGGLVTCYYTPGIYVLGADQPMQLEHTLTGPASAFFDNSGRLLVSEYSQNAVLAFERDGRLSCAFSGRFDRPHMARALDDGTVLVADTWNNKLQRFDSGGTLVDACVAPVSRPVAIDVDKQKGWLVTAWGDNKVVRFDVFGRPAGTLETPPLEKPYDARWLDDDRVVIADSHHARVLILNAPRFH
jgi:DNA-binding beta-propeller fold protein YncE